MASPQVQTHNETCNDSYVSLTKHEGFWLSRWPNLDDHQKVRELQTGDDDLLIASFPKSGNAWAQRIVTLIKEGEESEQMELDKMCLMIEHEGLAPVSNMKEPRLIKTHYPFTFIPRPFQEGKGKVLYIARNPKDVAVSFYFFVRSIKVYNYRKSFEDFFANFANGKVGFGPWYAHVKDFWEKSRDPKSNVKFVFYEDMKKDPIAVIKEIASFLGKEITEAEAERIADKSSFNAMKENPLTNYQWLDKSGHLDFNVSKYMRKGIVGDWKSFYTPEMSHEIDDIVEKELSPLGIKFTYE